MINDMPEEIWGVPTPINTETQVSENVFETRNHRGQLIERRILNEPIAKHAESFYAVLLGVFLIGFFFLLVY